MPLGFHTIEQNKEEVNSVLNSELKTKLRHPPCIKGQGQLLYQVLCHHTA